MVQLLQDEGLLVAIEDTTITYNNEEDARNLTSTTSKMTFWFSNVQPLN